MVTVLENHINDYAVHLSLQNNELHPTVQAVTMAR